MRDVRAFGRIATDAGIRALATGFIEDKNRNLYETAGFKVHSFLEIFDGLDMRDFGYSPTAPQPRAFGRTDASLRLQGLDLVYRARGLFHVYTDVTAKFHTAPTTMPASADNAQSIELSRNK